MEKSKDSPKNYFLYNIRIYIGETTTALNMHPLLETLGDIFWLPAVMLLGFNVVNFLGWLPTAFQDYLLIFNILYIVIFISSAIVLAIIMSRAEDIWD